MNEPKRAGETGVKAANSGSNSLSLKSLYQDMLLIRRFEEKAGQL